MKALIILPTYNEAENLPRLLPEILARAPEGAEILVVDDNSPDGTGKVAEALASKERRIAVMHRPGKAGLGSAYLAGFKAALERNADAVLQMDSDFSHSPEYLPRFFEALREADVVIGSRYIPGGGIEGWARHRLALSRLANLYARLILGVPVRDLTGGFRCLKKEVLRGLDLDSIFSEGYSFQIELNIRALRRGFKLKEIPIVFRERARGRSKLSTGIVWEAVFCVWRLRFLGGDKKENPKIV